MNMVNRKVNFVFGDLNSRGGGERLTLVTMKATLNKGIKSFDLTTLYRPNLAQLDISFGRTLSSVMKSLRKIYIISILDYLENSDLVVEKYSKKDFLTINTHGDKIPYYNPDMTKDNSIVYCHYPTALHQIYRRNEEYLENDLNIITSKGIDKFNPIKTLANSSEKQVDNIGRIFKLLKNSYTN